MPWFHSSQMTYFFLGIFLCLPPLLLALKFIRQKPRWWVIVIAIAVGGWLAWFLVVTSHFEELQSRVSSMDNPDPDLLDQAYSDGGPLVFAAFLGWLAALLYAFPWWVIYLLAAMLRRFSRRG